MKKTMKNLAVLLMALVLVLPWTTAMAGETTSDKTNSMPSDMTITADLEIEKDTVHELAKQFGMTEAQMKLVSPVVELLSALQLKVTYADNGAQLDLDLNDKKTFSLAGEVSGKDLRIASTLFPNYVISVSAETLMDLMQIFMPSMGQGDMDSLAMYFEAAADSLAEYTSEFVDTVVNSVVPGEPEEAEFSWKGCTFNYRIPVAINVNAIVNAGKLFVIQMVTDPAISSMLEQVAMITGKSFTEEDVMAVIEEVLTEEAIPELETSIYLYADEKGDSNSFNGYFCIVSEGTYKGYSNPSYRFTILSQDNADSVISEFELVDLGATATSSVNITEHGIHMRYDYKMEGLYFGYTMDMVYGENDITTVYALFFQDDQNPVGKATITISTGGQLTLATSGDGKTELTLEQLTSFDGEAIEKLMQDIMSNGFNNLISTITNAVPEAADLFQQKK